MPKMVERVCACGCGVKFQARAADVKRGWGRFSSKSCKAIAQEKRTGQHRNYKLRKKVMHYHKKYGGIPQFHPRTGEYEGSCALPGDVSESQDG